MAGPLGTVVIVSSLSADGVAGPPSQSRTADNLAEDGMRIGVREQERGLVAG